MRIDRIVTACRAHRRVLVVVPTALEVSAVWNNLRWGGATHGHRGGPASALAWVDFGEHQCRIIAISTPGGIAGCHPDVAFLCRQTPVEMRQRIGWRCDDVRRL